MSERIETESEKLGQALVGSWSLRSYTERDLNTGEISHPFGEDAVGTITYSSDGRMSVLIGRSNLDSNRTDMFVMTPEEATVIATGFLAYCGTYVCEPNLVTHRVEISSIPAFSRVQQQRAVEMERNLLTLSTVTPIVSRQRTVNATLIWQRSSEVNRK